MQTKPNEQPQQEQDGVQSCLAGEAPLANTIPASPRPSIKACSSGERPAGGEPARNGADQYAADAVYRFLSDRLYVGGRYNVVKGDLSTAITDVTVDRKALAAGWFISPTMLTKLEWVQQSFDGFPSTEIQHGAEFSGVVIQGAIAF